MTTKILELTVATLVFSSLVATPRTEQPVSAEALDIGSRRELFVDDYLIDSVKGTALRLGRPLPAEVILKADRPWEGAFNFGNSVHLHEGLYRLYYRGLDTDVAKSFGCGSFRTGDSGAVERKMDLSYYGSGEGILGLGSWVGQNNLTRKTDRLDFWIFLLHPLQVRARGAAHRDQLAVRVARGMVSERLLPLVKAPIGVEVSAGLQRTQA